MFTIGVHVGRFAIRISQSYVSSSGVGIRFDPVRWPSHAQTDWYAYYDGALPNAYDPASGKVGYEAIDAVGPTKASRLDSDFFQSMLGDGVQRESACQVWRTFQRLLRRCLRRKERVRATLFLDGVDLSSPIHKWIPWGKREDRIPALLGILQALGSEEGFDFDIVTERPVVERLVTVREDVQAGDILAIVGSRLTRIWEVVGPEKGGVRPVGNAQGLENLLTRLGNSGELTEDNLKRLLGFLLDPLQQWELDTLRKWQEKELFPTVRKVLAQTLTMGRTVAPKLFAAGEGAALLQGLDTPLRGLQPVEWHRSHLFIPADAAAALALQHP